MVEAPRIRILYERIRFTKGKRIVEVSGPSYRKWGVDLTDYVVARWWYAGKYIYVQLVRDGAPTYVVRTHMMMYGRIVINDEVPVSPLARVFMTWVLEDGTTLRWFRSQITLLDPTCETDTVRSNYAECCSLEMVRQGIRLMRFDISHPKYDRGLHLQKLETDWAVFRNDILVDLLLDQKYFPGVGNILQQEALYRCRVLPTKTVDEAGMPMVTCLVDELSAVIALLYRSYERKLEALPHEPILQIYRKGMCPLGHKTVTRYLGYHNRRTTWCPVCQT